MTPPLAARRNAAIAFILVTAVLDIVAMGIIIPVLPALIEEFTGYNARAGMINGVFVALWALMQFVASPVVGSLSDRYGRRLVILLSAAGLGSPTTDLDYFNFPWLVIDDSALPYVTAQVNGAPLDLSGRKWPPEADGAVLDAGWIGAFHHDGENAPGLALTLPADSRTRLRVGSTTKRVVLNVVDDRADFVYGREGIYIISAVRTSETVKRGEAIVSRSYLAFGDRAEVAANLALYLEDSLVSEFEIGPTQDPEDVVLFCGSPPLSYDVCGAEDPAAFGLLSKACTICLPVYELSDRAGETFMYTTDPYFGPESDPISGRYGVTRILGWLYPDSHMEPDGFTKKPLRAGNDEQILLDTSDEDQFFYVQ